MGVPWKDTVAVGGLLGTRMVLNEFIAYARFGAIEATLDPRTLHDRHLRPAAASRTSARSASRSAASARSPPSGRSDLARFGLRAMLAGTLATFLTACIAGMLL